VTATPETVVGTVEQTTTEEGPASTLEGDASSGAKIYASSGCGGCHTLDADGSSGAVGPNLDQSKPDPALTINRVTNGAGAMPAFEGQLSDQEIADVAQYVVESTQ
jgi:mono/diheme cytochrome c family protein